MKQLLPFLIVVLLFSSCKQKNIDLTKIAWQPLDTALSVYFEKKDRRAGSGKHEIVFVGYLDETKHTLMDSSITKNFVGFAIPGMKDYLQKKLPRLIPGHSEGYLKLSLYDLATSSARVDVYLNDNIKEKKRDSVLSFISKRREVTPAVFISKDSAIKSMMKEYAEDEQKEAFKQMLLKEFPSLVESINYAALHAGAFKGNAFIFHFR